ncbi:hypothetical protein J4573_08590 [Actinomadura barringtoniae]|uniref:Uncharacterized protein n=1 Tax=Actinomadura barringtoniae TaxID=1427535 RepID=A0A939T1A6_9ACTN|nr:hypothetical protein [Actinomadura barringtoniae]MBO2447141.1 hypothetical protein [Actinomadura barringtoniae]
MSVADSVPVPDAGRHARRMARAVGDLNHATAPWNAWPGLQSPQQVSEVLHPLGAGSLALQRSIKQIRGYLAHTLREGRVGCDRGEPMPAVTAAAMALHQAEIALAAVASALERARTVTSGLCQADPNAKAAPDLGIT